MTDVRLTATNPEDSSVIPVACNAKGELKLEEPILVEGPKGDKGDPGDPGDPGKDGDPFTGNFDGDVSFTGAATFSEDAVIHGATVGCGGSGITTNTVVGAAALHFNTSGSNNTAIGWAALQVNTQGENNTAVGLNTLRQNTKGSNNTAVGNSACRFTTEGNANTAVGREALYSNTSGSNNTAVGRNAARENTEGVSNTAVGHGASQENTTGNNNTSVGREALATNTTGVANTCFGRSAGRLLTGDYNTFIGNYQGAVGLSSTFSLSTGSTERMRIAEDDAVDFNQKCGFTADGGLWITDTRGNKMRTTFSTGEFMQWEPYEFAARNEPQLSDEEME